VKLLAAFVALLLAGVGVGIFFALRSAAPSAFPEERFETRAEAQAAGALGPGAWLPPQIPEGATRLHESHNPSTHQTWGEFLLPPGSEGWRPALSPNQPGELMLLGAPKNVAWWPAFLRLRVSSAELEKQGYRFFVVEKGEKSPLVFGVRGQQVYYWRLARQ
jgi:hypothetical protein